MTIDLDTARRVVAEIRAAGKGLGLKPLTVTVLDAGGHVVAAEREDGASMSRFEIAYGKAHGALALGMGSRALMNRAEQQPYFMSAVTMAIGGYLIPVPGGVIIRSPEGALIGAVGVSGDTSDNDEKVAVFGVQAINHIAETG